MKSLKENITLISVIVGLLVAFSGGLWKVWSMEAQVRDNTYWIDEERYDRLEERIAYKEATCGEDALQCSDREQDTVRRWKRQKRKLGIKLGYER